VSSRARVAVIGGGVVGCSVLYHLTRLGWRDVLLLERDELTAGSTWHAAGNCPNFSTSWTLLKLQHYSTQLYRRLAEEVGYEINYHRTGSLRLAHTSARVDEFRHVLAQARAQGLPFELLTPGELPARHPFLSTTGLRAALWDPEDGDIDPAQLTQALAKGARDRGAAIQRNTRVLALAPLKDGGWQLETSAGVFTADIVVNAAGYRGGEIAAMIGEYLPIVTLSHQYLVTEAIPELMALGQARLPLVRDPDVSYYLRQERHGLLLGPYEAQPVAHWLEGLPEAFAHQLFEDDLGRLEAYIEDACQRVPLLGSVGVRRVINGPIPYAPDGNPLLGPARAVPNFFHCCAFTFGIVQAGGAGRLLAEWLVNGAPHWDAWVLDTRRYFDFADRRYALAKALETYRYEYAVAYPQEERPGGRPGKCSPLYGELGAAGAVFGARGGWERAVYFREASDPPGAEASFRRAHWHRAVERETAAVASAVGLLEMPGFARFELRGRGAAAWLDHMISGAVPRVGRVALCYLCAPNGGVVSEMTVLHLAPEHFWLISAAAAERHDEQWLHGHLSQRHGPVHLSNLTANHGALVIAGPRARELLGRCAQVALANPAFPWLSVRELTLAGTPVLAARINYVGELGWELHVPNESLPHVYRQLRAAGDGLALANFGLYAQESLRLEKGYRSWKAELTSEYSPLAAGLERFVQLDKAADYIGRDALQREAQSGPRERCVALLVDAADADAAAVSVLYRGEEAVGLVTSAGYGYRLQRSIALGYVRADLAVAGTRLELEILGERRNAVIAAEPLYDPGNERLRA
jgi:dimethylglycine dehydrogenase